MNEITEILEGWLYEKKGRYVNEISHDCGYGATCWSVIIGNTDMKAKEGWHVADGWAKKYNKAEVYASEISFWEYDEDVVIPPNIVFASIEDFVGLKETILAAINQANELGL